MTKDQSQPFERDTGEPSPLAGARLRDVMVLIFTLFMLAVVFTTMAWWSPEFDKTAKWQEANIIAFVMLWILAGGLCLLCYGCLRGAGLQSLKKGKLWLGLILLGGVLFRGIFMFSTPILEDDHYRYLWDGQQVLQGGNPYQTAPADLSPDPTDAEAVAVHERINHPTIKTIYPPVAQATFALAQSISPYSILGWRLLILIAEIATVVLLLLILKQLNLPWIAIVLYWWNPIVIKEFANAVHMDAIMLPLLLGALLLAMKHRTLLATILIMLAAGVKVWPVLLLPLLWRNRISRQKKDWWVLGQSLAVAVLMGFLIVLPIYLGGLDESSGFRQYAGRWQNNDGLFKIIHAVSLGIHQWFGIESWHAQDWSRRAAGVILLCVIGLLCLRRWNPNRLPLRMLILVAALFMLSPTQFPWYYAWVLPFLVIRPVWGLLLYTALLPIYAMQFHYEAIHPDLWHEFQKWGPWFVHVPVWLVLMVEGIRGLARQRHLRLQSHGRLSDTSQTNGEVPLNVAVIIPVLNEEQTLGAVLDEIYAQGCVDRIVVADNGSSDRSPQVAREHGAIVVDQPRRGYGSACLKGIEYLKEQGAPDIVVFVDADGSDTITDLPMLLQTMRKDQLDLIIASRVKGRHEPGALSVTQRFGNALSCTLTWIFFGVRYSDLGPFRAMTWDSLMSLEMADPDYGWTIEMQVKAARQRLKIGEIASDYKRRAGGKSKVSGTIRGIWGAGTKILGLIFYQAFDAALNGRYIQRES